MDERTVELYWNRAERWVGGRAHAQMRRGLVLCPMCYILPVEGSFLVGRLMVALCLECAREAKTGRRPSKE